MHGIGIWSEQDGSVRKGEWQLGKRIQYLEELKKGDSFKQKNPNFKVINPNGANSIANRSNVIKNEALS